MHDDADDERPSVARVHDYLVGGTQHRAVDREFADELVATVPGIDDVIRELLVFRPRVVAHLAAQGVDQFLDLGAGLPTVVPTHEVAERALGYAPRVVYVDRDPAVAAAAAELLAGVDGAVAVVGDVADAGSFLPAAARALDLDRPVAVIASAVLHYADDDAAHACVRALHARTAPGSRLAIASLSARGRPEPVAWARQRHGGLSYPPRLREPEHMAPWLDGFDLEGPGWAAATAWDPAQGTGPTPAQAGSAYWAVLARRR